MPSEEEKRYRKLITGVSIISILCLLSGCSLDKKVIKENNQNNKKTTQVKVVKKQIEKKVNKVIFNKNDNLFLYDEMKKTIKSIGDESKLKDLPSVSPDKSKVVFRYFFYDEAIYPQEICIYDLKTDKLSTITIKNKNAQQIIDIKWVDEENILITSHINPSVSFYVVYNINKKNEINSCRGIIRDVLKSNKAMIYSESKHVNPPIPSNLYIDNDEIYEVSNKNEKIYDAKLSKDGSTIAFRSFEGEENDINKIKATYLNIGIVDKVNKKIDNMKKINIDPTTTGEFVFSEENTVSIVGEEFIYTLDNDKVKKTLNIKKHITPSEEQIIKFKRMLCEYFQDEAISEEMELEDMEVYNEEWF